MFKEFLITILLVVCALMIIGLFTWHGQIERLEDRLEMTQLLEHYGFSQLDEEMSWSDADEVIPSKVGEEAGDDISRTVIFEFGTDGARKVQLRFDHDKLAEIKYLDGGEWVVVWER